MTRLDLPAIGIAPLSGQELFDLATRADKLSTEIEDLRDFFRGTSAKMRQEVEDDLQDIPAPQRRRMVEAATKARINKFRQEVLVKIDAHLKEVGAIQEKANQQKPFFDNKTQFLMGVTLGNEDRARFDSQLRSAGPLELQSAAREALLRKDQNLVAAIVSRLNELKPSERPFRVGEIIDRVEIPRFTAAVRNLGNVESRIQEGILAQREVRDRRTGSTQRIQMGLDSRTLQESNGRIKLEDGSGDDDA